MSLNTELPYSFCKRYGIIATTSLDTGEVSLVSRDGTPVSAIAEAQRLLGMVDHISVESEVDFNRLLGQHFENNRGTSFTEAEKIGGELNLDDVARELSEPEDLLESDDDARTNNYWLILLFHKIVASPTVSTEYSITNFGTVVDDIATDGIAVKTISQAIIDG